MENRILFLGAKGSFISHAIIDNLKENGLWVVSVPAETSQITTMLDMPNFIFINLEESVKENRKLLSYLKDRCIAERKYLMFTGYGQDIDDVVAGMPASIIGGRFERPINSKEIGKMVRTKIEVYNHPEKPHILVVDDSGVFLRSMKTLLSNDFEVSLVNSGQNALNFLENSKPDLILLDYEMPGCSGPQLLEMIRTDPSLSKIPVIFLTSNDDKESVKAVLGLKPQGYLLKTLNQEVLLEKIDGFLNKNVKF